MKIYSNCFNDNEEFLKPIKALEEQAKRARRIIIFTAYISEDSVSKLCSKVPKGKRNKCEIVIVVPLQRGPRLKQNIERLKALNKDLREQGFLQKNIDIKLNEQKTLFHTKLYHFMIHKSPHWFIGSANATHPGFYKNEEILFHFIGAHKELSKYLDCVINASEKLDQVLDTDSHISSWENFFGQGALYFRSSVNVQFNYDGLKMPTAAAHTLTKMSASVRYAEPGQPFGAFSILRASEFEDKKAVPREKAVKITVSAYALETSLGYWVPSPYLEEFNLKIEKSEEFEIERFRGIRSKIYDQGGLEFLCHQYDIFLADAKIIIEQSNQTLVDDKGNEWKPSYKDAATGFEKHAKRFLGRLDKEAYILKCASDYVETVMPDIWSDQNVTEDFLESFIEYVTYKLETKPGQKIVKSLIKGAGIEVGDHEKTVRDKIEKAITKNELCPSEFWL